MALVGMKSGAVRLGAKGSSLYTCRRTEEWRRTGENGMLGVAARLTVDEDEGETEEEDAAAAGENDVEAELEVSLEVTELDDAVGNDEGDNRR